MTANVPSNPQSNSPIPEFADIHPEALTPAQLQALAQSLIDRIRLDAKNIQSQNQELTLRQAKIDALTHEIRLLRHLRFCAKTEVMDAVQVKLFEEANAEDLADAQQRLAQLDIKPAPAAPKSRPTRQRLPAPASKSAPGRYHPRARRHYLHLW